MKAALCVLLLATALVSAEEKKPEKRGVLGLGYGHAPLAGYYGHGLGLYNHGLYGGGLYGHGLYNHGLYGHAPYSAPLLGHGVYGHLPYSAPLLGLGHGWH